MTGGWVPSAVYLLCFITSAACAGLLLRSYLNARSSLLFWSAGCFSLLALNNLLVILDMLVITSRDLMPWRLAASLAAASFLLFGFIWRGDDA
ncbi:DUF5985 family protein [Sphingomonas sp. ID1715]|uniref:DUF5985 family protein n=1 Tax=Sphingomonas sp. ID1715 TaxID=1656898 RepID=UPI0020C3B8BE|nr:DUF5985 family protein [Sphingomonas sp. ID1715]